jgi:hypothetical protein
MHKLLATTIALAICSFASSAPGQEPGSGFGSGKVSSQPKPAQGNSENIDYTLRDTTFGKNLTHNTAASYDSRNNIVALRESHSAEQTIVPLHLGTEPIDIERTNYGSGKSETHVAQFYYSMALESRSYGFAWYTNYDWTNFQERLTNLGNQGFRIENIDTYGRAVFDYAGTWTQDGRGWAWVLNYTNYSTFLSILNNWPNGSTRYRPIDFAINLSGTQASYGAVAVADNVGFAWLLNESDLNTFLNWISNQYGLSRRIVEIQFYSAGSLKCAGISKDAGYAQQVGINLSAAGFSNWNTQYVNLGYRLVDFDKYCVGGTVYYAGLWNNDGKGYAYSLDHTNASTFQSNVNNYISQGFKPIMVDVYDDDWVNPDAVEDESQPSGFYLRQNFPNPFNPTTTIQYEIPQRSFVTLKVYDLLGEEVAILANEEKSAGNYEVSWDAADLPSGVYFYRLQAEGFVQSKKLMILR